LTVTEKQSKVEFSFWSLFNSPLIVTTDIRDMNGKSALLNKEVIAVNQDDVRYLPARGLLTFLY